MCQIEEIELGSLVQSAVDSANAMCNPDKWKFEWEWSGDDCIVSCTCTHGFYSHDVFEDAHGYCRDLAHVVKDILQRFDDENWRIRCSDGKTIKELKEGDPVEYDELKIYDGVFCKLGKGD